MKFLSIVALASVAVALPQFHAFRETLVAALPTFPTPIATFPTGTGAVGFPTPTAPNLSPTGTGALSTGTAVGFPTTEPTDCFHFPPLRNSVWY
ncbi:hypothetical protein GX50_03955 [[Emmonsia] crescens]|uniref:Uncharacterized protein n=1 Tax=[Emmonsia] crescens TaxID=73230 RepID=A0A2B7Z9S8_9EURO|nr:hypothetical protein GX50_03955 [Emmonsia crescens]